MEVVKMDATVIQVIMVFWIMYNILKDKDNKYVS